ncbi:MAG: flagellar basal body L-ring protein FlgH [Sphingomonadaceae bacterium]
MSTRRFDSLALLILLGGCFSNPLKDRVAYIPPAPPIPQPPAEVRAAAAGGSIWGGSVYRIRLAEDRRAAQVGDIVTIQLVERMTAQKANQQTAQRSSQRSIDFTGFPQTAPFERALSGGSDSSFSGRGAAQQSNRLSGEFTVTVVEVLPNGALRVAGDRRIYLTRGEEQVQLTGIIRPEDITPDNRILSTRVADASIRYSGTGEMAQQARMGWLTRFFDRINPY